MELFFKSFHSVLRWLLLAALLFAIVKAFIGWFNKKSYGKIDDKAGLWTILFCHIQLLLGFILYFFLSGITKTAFSDFGAAMKNSDIRFWAVEHILVMIIAVVIIQIGRIKSKKTTNALLKHKYVAIYFSIGLLLILSRIPWTSDRMLTFFM